jgi:hypothetical protein
MMNVDKFLAVLLVAVVWTDFAVMLYFMNESVYCYDRLCVRVVYNVLGLLVKV